MVVPAQFASALRLTGMVFSPHFEAFSHSVRLDVSAHFSALDGQLLLVVEGSAWRGRQVRLPGIQPPQKGASLRRSGKHIVVNASSEPQPPQPPQPPQTPHSRFPRECPVCVCAFHENSSGRCQLNAMAPPLRRGGGIDGCEVPGGASSSASLWLWQPNAAPRGQNTGARAREEVVQATYEAPRGQKTPPPGAAGHPFGPCRRGVTAPCGTPQGKLT